MQRTGYSRRNGQLFECMVLLSRPGIDKSQILDQERTADGILGDRQQLDGAATFTNCFLFVAKDSVSHSENAERFGIVWLLAQQLGGFVARGGKGSTCRRFITSNLRDQALAPSAGKRNCLSVTASDRKRSERALCTLDIALAKRHIKQLLGQVFSRAWILCQDFLDRRNKGARIGM